MVHVKLQLGVLFSIIVLLSLCTQVTYVNNIQAVPYHVHTRDSLAQSSTGISVIDPKVEYFGNNTWNTLNLAASVTPTVFNSTLMRFTATVFYTNISQIALLHFLVNMYNDSSASVPIYIFNFHYPTQLQPDQKLNQNTAITAIQTGNNYFPDPKLSYFLQIGFQYEFTSNTTDVTTVYYAHNVSISMDLNTYTPPDVLVWIFYGVTILIIAQVTIGFVGSKYYAKRSGKIKKFN